MKHQTQIQNVPRETYDSAVDIIDKNRGQVTSYIDRLLWWNNKISLISRTISRKELEEHVVHSILPMLILQQAGTTPKHIVDCGSGGGLPGIPLAICFPNIPVTLNDISIKKILAVKDMVRHLDINDDMVTFSRCDVRSLHLESPATVFSKHAFKINFLVNALQKLPIERFIFYKGGDIENELDDIDQDSMVISHNLSMIGKVFYDSKLIAQITIDNE